MGKGDIVLIRSPEDPRKIVTKRVVGMEGDSVDYSVNGDSDGVFETIVVRIFTIVNQVLFFMCVCVCVCVLIHLQTKNC